MRGQFQFHDDGGAVRLQALFHAEIDLLADELAHFQAAFFITALLVRGGIDAQHVHAQHRTAQIQHAQTAGAEPGQTCHGGGQTQAFETAQFAGAATEHDPRDDLFLRQGRRAGQFQLHAPHGAADAHIGRDIRHFVAQGHVQQGVGDRPAVEGDGAGPQGEDLGEQVELPPHRAHAADDQRIVEGPAHAQTGLPFALQPVAVDRDMPGRPDAHVQGTVSFLLFRDRFRGFAGAFHGQGGHAAAGKAVEIDQGLVDGDVRRHLGRHERALDRGRAR